MKPNVKPLLGASLILGGVLCSAANAAVVVTPTNENAGATGVPSFTPTYTISPVNNVLFGLLPSATTGGSFTIEGSGGLPVLTNGDFGLLSNDGGPTATHPTLATFGANAGTSITYTFAPTQLVSVFVYGGWNDNGRDQQSYTVQYSTNGTTFVDLQSVNFNPILPNSIQSANRIAFTDTTGTLAGGALITNLRINTGAVENQYAGLAEIAAYAVPEPTAAALGALGLLGLLRRRRA